MKKFFKAASILAAVSMMFAFASCQQDPETPPTSGTAPVFEAKTQEVDLAALGVTSITEVNVANPKIATATAIAESTKVTVTSVAKGTTTATVKVAGKKDGKDATGEAALTITVSETGAITVTKPDSIDFTVTPESGEENPGENPGGNEPGENPGGEETPAANSFFETFATITKSDGTVLEQSKDWLTLEQTTYTTPSGISINASTDTKVATKSDSSFGDITNTNCVQLGKKSNGSKIVIPVSGNCKISILIDSNKVPSADYRSLLATVTASDATIKDGANGTAGTTAFHSYADDSARVKEVFSFYYEGGAGNVELECCKTADGTSAGGAIYLYGIGVEY